MAATIPTHEPSEFVIGETVKWKKYLADYPPATWTLSYAFINSGAKFTESTSAASGSDHLVTITAAATGALTAGWYKWQAKVTDGTSVYLVGQGTCQVKSSFAAESTLDGRTYAETALDALEAVMEGKASSDQAAMSVGGRSLSRFSPEELYVWRERLKAEVAKERREERLANGLGHSGKVRIRFKD